MNPVSVSCSNKIYRIEHSYISQYILAKSLSRSFIYHVLKSHKQGKIYPKINKEKRQFFCFRGWGVLNMVWALHFEWLGTHCEHIWHKVTLEARSQSMCAIKRLNGLHPFIMKK